MANEDTNQQGNGNMDNTLVTHVANVESEAGNSPSKDPISDDNVAPRDRDEIPRADPGIPIDQRVREISQFAASLSVVNESHPLETPKYVDAFLDKFESELEHYESKFGHSSNEDSLFFKAIDGLALLVESVSKFKSTSNSASILLNLATSHLHRAMLVLEDELRNLLHKWNTPTSNKSDPNSSKDQQQQHDNEADHCVLPDRQHQSDHPNHQQHQQDAETFPRYSSKDFSTMISISRTMVSAGYGVDCIKVFMVVRRTAFEEELVSQGFEKISIDDVQRMHWEALEGEIATWIRIVKHCISHLFPGELSFYQSVFSSTLSQFEPNYEIRMVLFSNLARPVIQQLLKLANAVSFTKKSSEKLFKFLDMYETLRALGSWLHESSLTDECSEDFKLELAAAWSCLGEVVISIFYELETSIKSDHAKQPVPDGAVHPLTRYTMNYLKYACEYKDSLEELFLHHVNSTGDIIDQDKSRSDNDPIHNNGRPERSMTPFIGQLMRIMDLLDENLEAKSKLYKDPSLRYIFLMNNGRYMLQKIRGSAEIHQAMGDNWCRKRSSDLRSYHKSYQRDTWSKVLQCLNHEGLQVNGKVPKLVLKDRFKNFNQSFDELHKTQSMWMVSDEQMKSELRVSISAVMIPAYRAFLARFGQVFSPGRQYEKHIKYQPDDIETAIEELFEGSPSSRARRRRE